MDEPGNTGWVTTVLSKPGAGCSATGAGSSGGSEHSHGQAFF